MDEPQSDNPVQIPVFLNPLTWTGAALSRLGQVPTEGNLLEFLQGPLGAVGFQEIVARYQELSHLDSMLLQLPMHPSVAENILLPIVQAKGAYMLGHYVSCIALCGAIAESLAVFRYEVAPPVDGRPTVGEFDEERQSDREKKLHSWGLIDCATRERFGRVRRKRRPYLHRATSSKVRMKEDARESYGATIQLLISVLGVGLRSGMLTLHPDVMTAMQALPAEPAPGTGP